MGAKVKVQGHKVRWHSMKINSQQFLCYLSLDGSNLAGR